MGINRETEIIEKPELFSNSKKIILGRGENITPISIEISAEGIYAGNGEYQDPQDQIFPLIGFDRTDGRNRWIGRAFIITRGGI